MAYLSMSLASFIATDDFDGVAEATIAIVLSRRMPPQHSSDHNYCCSPCSHLTALVRWCRMSYECCQAPLSLSDYHLY